MDDEYVSTRARAAMPSPARANAAAGRPDRSDPGATGRHARVGVYAGTGQQAAMPRPYQRQQPLAMARSRAQAMSRAIGRNGRNAWERIDAVSVALQEKTGTRIPFGLIGTAIVLVAIVIGGMIAVPQLVQVVHSTSTGPVTDDPYTAIPGPSPTPPAHFTAFTSAHSNYSIDYPTGWSVSSQEQATQGKPDYIDIFLQATSNPTASFYVEQAVAAANVPDAQVIASEVSGAQQGGTTLTAMTSTPTDASIGGAQWQRRDFTVKVGNSTSHEVILACHHGHRSFVIVYIAPTSSFDSATTTDFTPMLASFRFAS